MSVRPGELVAAERGARVGEHLVGVFALRPRQARSGETAMAADSDDVVSCMPPAHLRAPASTWTIDDDARGLEVVKPDAKRL